MAGFCCTMKEESDLSLREHLLDYIIVLFVDASGFLWAVAKASHAVLLFCMEQDEVSDLSQIEKIDPIQQANAQKHNHGGQNASGISNPVKKSTAKNTKSMPCNFFIIRTFLLMTKHTRHVEWFTDTCALLALLMMAEVSTILNPFVFIYLEFYVDFNTVQVISRRVVGRAEETSTYSSLGFCTVNC